MLTRPSIRCVQSLDRPSWILGNVFRQEWYGKSDMTGLRRRAVSDNIRSEEEIRIGRTRRECLVVCGGIWFRSLQSDRTAIALEVEPEDSVRLYRDPGRRYEITVPLSWIQSEKPGAEVLFKNRQRSSSNLGITINPVKVASLTNFGSLEEIGERLFNVERQKVKGEAMEKKTNVLLKGWVS